MIKKWLSGEKMNSMVGAEFKSAEAAQAAADTVRTEAGLESADLRIVRPGDPAVDRKLEPESHGIALTLVRAHVVLGVVGLVAGLLVSLLLVGLQIQPFVSSPVLSILVITAFATVAGLLAGGLFSLRPDHDPVIQHARKSAESGHWFVVVHMRKPEQRQRAQRILERVGDDTIRTI